MLMKPPLVTPATTPTATSWLLRSQAGSEVKLPLAPATTDAIAAVARLQRRQPEAIVAEILDAAVSGRLQAQRLVASPAGRTSATAAGVLVHGRLMEGLQKLAGAAGQPAGTYGAAVLADWLQGASAARLNLDCGQLFASDDARIKAWLPHQVRQALSDLADLLGMSDSDVVRSSVFAHLYGRLAYEQAVRAGAWRPSRRNDDIDFSDEPGDGRGSKPKAPRTALIEQIGKSETQFTVFMPTALRVQLWATAERAGMRASEYLRRHLATYLLGRLAVDALPLQAVR